MMTSALLICSALIVLACFVNGQCPPNTAMGLCHAVAKPCFGDSDCFRGEICCPESCSRTCKSRNGGHVTGGNTVPDLLNDPRVYIGKCPQASCYSMFGGGPNQCSTSNLCPQGQFCCNDGCKNVCQWTPEVEAKLAQEEARAKQHQQMIIQRQQEEMRKRQQEMLAQRQRQQALAEMARQQAEARAAAEAELAAQEARAKYEAGLRAAAGAQAKATKALQQRMAQLRVQQQQKQQRPAPSSTGSFLDNFVGEPFSVRDMSGFDQKLQQPRLQNQRAGPYTPPDTRRFLPSNKRDNLAGSFTNEINSPANANPYGPLPQQNINSKGSQGELLSLIQSAPHTSLTQYPPQNVPTSYSQQPLPSSGIPSYPTQTYYQTQPTSLDYVSQTGDGSSYNGQRSQGAVVPLLMYHAMQTAA